MPGNHDVDNERTPESLARYRELIGPDYHAFRGGRHRRAGARFEPEESAAARSRLSGEDGRLAARRVGKARRDKVPHVIVFQHIPSFFKDASEEDQYFNIPPEMRRRYLKLLHEYGVREVFAGHLSSQLRGPRREPGDGDQRAGGNAARGSMAPPRVSQADDEEANIIQQRARHCRPIRKHPRPPNGSALCCEPQRLGGGLEAS